MPIVYGKRLVDAESTAGGVLARFGDGSTATADLLIGADGIRSRVRTLIDPRPTTWAEAHQTPPGQWLHRLREVYADDVPAHQALAHTEPADVVAIGSIGTMPSVPHWCRDRMVLVGDAVHAPSPSSGQGASLAVESAVQLARCLRDHPDLPTALSAYEGLRRPRVEKVLRPGQRGVGATLTGGAAVRARTRRWRPPKSVAATAR
ncbi:FAD-dependent oxidoreductase [Micromonospora sp. NPDC048871]|uniref:FAD-dependent oxidoreductase n=1 Tax=Micromonospora sp. NPDC048871 TaxID=3364259 RepID=UPI003713A758